MDEELHLLLTHLLPQPSEEVSELHCRYEAVALLVEMLETLTVQSGNQPPGRPVITSTKSSTVSLMGLLETSCNIGRNVSKVTLASGPFS